jgi:DNA-binding response OmpR family regulator
MRILVIDDDPGVRMLCRIAFRADGDEVVEAASGREGLELLVAEVVDAVVLDVMLPSINGFEVLRRIRENAQTSDLPVVLLSVRVGMQDQIDGWRAGADEYLTKPFSPSALAAKLNEICRTGARDRADRRAQRVVERVPLQSA